MFVYLGQLNPLKMFVYLGQLNPLMMFVYLGQLNPLTTTLKPQSNGPLYSNTVIGTPLAVDGWAVTFGTARSGLGGAAACILYFILYDVAL